jgi:hypothetical protein
MIAVLLCMLANMMDPCTRASVSVDLLLGIDDGTRCTHEDLRPIDLAERLPSKMINGWSAELRRGWQIFCHILRPFEPPGVRSCEREPYSENSISGVDQGSLEDLVESPFTHTSDSSDEGDNYPRECDYSCNEFWTRYYDRTTGSYTSQFARRRDIGHVWAAVQTELLTYRRINEADPWLSSYFDLGALLIGLQTGNEISMPLLDNGMIQPYCRCGRSTYAWDPVLRESIANR